MNKRLNNFFLYLFTTELVFIIVIQASELNNGQVIGNNGIITFQKTEEITLQEYLNLVGDILGADVTTEGYIALLSRNPMQIYLYNRNGEQIRLIGREGRGPFEYAQASTIRYFNEKIYIYDGSKIGFIIFNDIGEPLREVSGNLRGGVRDFIISTEGYIVRLTGKTPNEIAVYKPELDNLISIHKFYEKEKENDMLSMLFDSGKIAEHGNKIYFANVAVRKAYVYDISDGTIDSVDIPDTDFFVPDLDFEIRSIQDLKRAEEYILNNSRVRAMYTMRDYWIVEIENGKQTNRTRTTKLFIYDYSNNLIDTIVLDHRFRKRFGLSFSDEIDEFFNILCNDEDHLYILTEEPDPNKIDILRKINVWRFERNE